MDSRLRSQARLVPFSGSMANAHGYATKPELNKPCYMFGLKRGGAAWLRRKEGNDDTC